MMPALRRVLAVAIAALCAAEWILVIERTSAAVWSWYKFEGYGGGGHVVLGRSTQAAFVLGSTVAAIVAYVLWKAMQRDEHSKHWLLVARVDFLSLAVCTTLWVIVIASPLVRLM